MLALVLPALLTPIAITVAQSAAPAPDTIPVRDSTKQLREVTVKGAAPLVVREVDRITYDIQADPESKSSNLLGMMRKIPFLSVDANENVLLKGNTSYKVLINGRSSGMLQHNLKNILRSMPASSIQKVEVITTPPAKYDAEGLAGIINIITTRKIDQGYNGSMNVSERFPMGGPDIGGALNIKPGKLGITVLTGGSLNYKPLTDYSIKRAAGGPASFLDQDGSRRSDSRDGFAGTELSYELDSINLVAGQFNVSGGKWDGRNDQHTSSTGNIEQQYQLQNGLYGNRDGIDAGLNFQHNSKKRKDRLLTLSYQYYKYESSLHDQIAFSQKINFDTPDYRQENDESARENTVQADYVHPVKGLRIEAGVKGIWRNNQSDFRYLALDKVSGDFKQDPDKSNRFDNTQRVLSIYNAYRYRLKTWELSAGMRLEQTRIAANFRSADTLIKQDYLNLIPSVAIGKQLKDNRMLTLGYVQRIGRPSINRLNPFADRSNPNYITTGNPALRPVLLNDIQLSYNISKKVSANIALSYTFFNNLDLRITVVDTATNITHSTFENIGKGYRLATDFYINYPVTSRLSLSMNGDIAYFRIKGLVDGTLVNNDWLICMLAPSANYSFRKGWNAFANVTINSRNIVTLQSNTNAYVNTGFGVNKTVIANKLTFSATASNPFSKYRNNITRTSGPGFYETNDTREYFRSFGISANYKFGKLKEGIRKTERGINNDDVSKEKRGQ
ncbi:outer membrane beta-barrel protein [Chitinophaga rupis]|nr:outer membrane beta-barrel protein [Chitinophaga rupis]